MPEKIIYLVRHALPHFPDGKKRCLGRRLDLPLGSEGLAQALALGESFSALPVEAVYTSPLLRAAQTARAIAGETTPLIVLDSLTELDGGAWDGLTFEEIRARFPRGSMPPGGETDESGLARALDALETIDRSTQRCAVAVAHGAINQTLLCALAGLPLREKKRFAQDHAGISVLEKRGGVWCIRE